MKKVGIDHVITRRVRAVVLAVVMVMGVVGGLMKVAGALSITSVDPERGPVEGGQEVTIYGDYFEPMMNVVQIEAHTMYACALDAYGKIYCWGSGNPMFGQLGNGSTESRYVPTSVDDTGVLAGKTISQISRACALDTEGYAYCWGAGPNGDGLTVGSLVPIAVDMGGALAGKALTQIVDSGNKYILDSEGKAYAWGSIQYGALGNGVTGTSSSPNVLSPTPIYADGVLAGKTLVQLSGGSGGACAIDSEGSAYCWGWGDAGRLGRGSTANSAVPVAVNASGVLAGKKLVQISSKGKSTCVLDEEGRAYCWGQGSSGQLGNGASVNSNIPVEVDMTGVLAGKKLVKIANGGALTCALDQDGVAYCWGLNSSGELGIGSNINSPIPVEVGGILSGKALKDISSSEQVACAVDASGQAYCWGRGNVGALGNNNSVSGISSYKYSPVCVHGALDGTGSALPGGCALNYSVIFDIDGTPAECTGVKVASDGKSLTCATTAHAPGLVDVTINDGTSITTLGDGYEYSEDYDSDDCDSGDDCDDDENDQDDKKGPLSKLLDKLLAPDTGMGAVWGIIVLSEVVFVVAGIAVFFKLREA